MIIIFVVLFTDVSIGLAVREATFVVYSVKYNLCRLSYLHITGNRMSLH